MATSKAITVVVGARAIQYAAKGEGLQRVPAAALEGRAASQFLGLLGSDARSVSVCFARFD